MILRLAATAFLAIVVAASGCATPRHTAPKPLGPPNVAAFTSFHSTTMSSSLSVTVTDDGRVGASEELTAVLRTTTGRIAFTTFEEAERGGVVLHAMQALSLTPDVVDVDVERGVLCTLTMAGLLTCGDLHASGAVHIPVVPNASRLLLVNRERRCVLGEESAWTCYRADGARWAPDLPLTRTLAVHAPIREPVSGSRCFITRDGDLVCVDPEGLAAAVVLRDVMQASMGRGTGDAGGGCAVVKGSTVKCWGGMNDTGVLGDGRRGPRSEPAMVANVKDAIAVSRTPDFACALTRDRHVWCWGSADAWSFGDGALARATAWPVCGERESPGKDGCVTRARFGVQRNHLVLDPVLVPELEGVLSIATSPTRTCGVRTDGRLLCVGGGHGGAYTVDLGPP